jgi:hypothetical protein
MPFAKSASAARTMKKPWRMALMLTPILLVLLAPSRNLRAQGAHSITLTWSQPAGGTQPVAFNVKRGTAPGAEVTIGTTTAPTTTYVDTTGVGGTTYYYVVTATNPQATPTESTASNEVSATFLPLPAMAAPTGLAAASN